MESLNRSITAEDRRNSALNKWNESDTAKASSYRSSQQFKIKFEQGAMLLSSVASGDLEETIRLLKEGADVNYANADGLSALHQACIDNNFPMVKALIDHGANIDACDNEGWTPLHAAASSSSLEIIKFMVNQGADVAALNSDLELPVDLTEEEQHIDFFNREMKRKGLDISDIRNSEQRAMSADVEKWKQQGSIDNKVKDPQGATPLHVAAAKDYLDIATTLLELGADPNARDDDGWTPLHAAVYWQNEEIIEKLLEYDADVDALNNFGYSPDKLADESFTKTVRSLFSQHRMTSKISNSAEHYQPVPISTPVQTKKEVIGILKSKNKDSIGDTKTSNIPRPICRPPTTPETTSSSKTIPEPTKVTGIDKTAIFPPSYKTSIATPTSITAPPAKPPSGRQDISSSTGGTTILKAPEIPKPTSKPIQISIASNTPVSSSEARNSTTSKFIVKPPSTIPEATPKMTLTEAMDKINKLEIELANVKRERDSLSKLVDSYKIQKNVTSSNTTPQKPIISRPPSSR